MQVLQEMYFGKVIALQQLEDVIDKLRIKYESDANNNPALIYKEVNRDPLVKKMAELIRDQFGFGEVIITITMDKKMRAATMSFLANKNGVAYIDELKEVNIKDALVVTKEGIRYDTKRFRPNILIMISMKLMFSKIISTEQLVAALLHEIGHSFSKATLGSKEFNARIDEKFADQFATMYGYGPELSKVLTMVSTNNQYDDFETLKNIPILNVFIGLNNIRKSLWDRLVNGNAHPTMDRRLHDSIRQMETDLNRADNLTPKQKAELMENIKVSKDLLDKYYQDTPRASDMVYKFYAKNIEPNLWKETKADKHAEMFGSSDMVDNQLRKRFKKKR